MCIFLPDPGTTSTQVHLSLLWAIAGKIFPLLSLCWIVVTSFDIVLFFVNVALYLLNVVQMASCFFEEYILHTWKKHTGKAEVISAL